MRVTVELSTPLNTGSAGLLPNRKLFYVMLYAIRAQLHAMRCLTPCGIGSAAADYTLNVMAPLS